MSIPGECVCPCIKQTAHDWCSAVLGRCLLIYGPLKGESATLWMQYQLQHLVASGCVLKDSVCVAVQAIF